MACAALAVAAAAQAESYVLLRDADLSEWQEQGFESVPARTSYAAVEDDALGARAVLIEADSSGSGYIRKVSLPFSPRAKLNVTWRVDSASNLADEQTKEGDDFPLRIYLADSTAVGADTLTLVHSVQHPVGSVWTSPYSGMLAEFEIYALGGSDTELGVWQQASVPVGQLWADLLGSPPDEIAVVGFMGDSDNAGGQSRALLAELELIVE